MLAQVLPRGPVGVRAWAGLLAFGSSYSPRLPGPAPLGPVATRGFRPRLQWRGRGGFAPPSLGPAPGEPPGRQWRGDRSRWAIGMQATVLTAAKRWD